MFRATGTPCHTQMAGTRTCSKACSRMKSGRLRRFDQTLFFDTNSAARIRIGRVENEPRKECARAIVEQ
jgi:hypothetical protein